MLIRANSSYWTAFLFQVPAIFVILAGLVAALSVLANDLYFFGIFPTIYFNFVFLGGAFFLALSGVGWGLQACILLLPISYGLGGQLNAYMGTGFLVLPNVGLDLVSGYYLGFIARIFFTGSLRTAILRIKPYDLKSIVPWPISLVLMLITVSTFTAIARNLYQSATLTSLKGLVFNLIHFRPIDWKDAYLPIADWIAYALAIVMIMLTIANLKLVKSKNQQIFRSVIVGLLIASLIGITQSITGIGLPDSLIEFRKDQWGYVAIGFQPDLHAYAGHMILGAIGLWAYFKPDLPKFERISVFLVITLSWIALIQSKSRAIFIFALMAMIFWLLVHLWINHKKHFFVLFLLVSTALAGLITLLVANALSVANITGLTWIAELWVDLKTRDLLNWSDLGGILGSRLEIWGAAWNMYQQFPLAGLGQGNFYHLSSIGSFSKSHYLILNNGENVHNYFLQTLTETGLVGAIIFIYALIYPYQKVAKKSILLPATVALGSLFLGNLFSHSFLVRENLILAAVFIGLIYSQAATTQSPNLSQSFFGKYSCVAPIIFSLIVSFAYVFEVINSFDKAPFTYGIYCYRKEPLTQDGWTRGVFELPIPRGSKGVELQIDMPQINDSAHPVDLILELRHVRRNQFGYNDTINFTKQEVVINQKYNNKIAIYFADQDALNKLDNVELVGRLSHCYSPRNSGDSVDSRLLGMQIKSIKVFN